jgi:O-antigen/teichoic acid export membrane protein
MRSFVQKLKTKPRYLKALEWTKLISITGGAHTIVQGLSFVSGIIVVRLLPNTELALYTIANTMLGTIALLSDGGISTGVMAQGGKVWQDRTKLGKVLMTGLDLRIKFAIICLVVSIPALIYLLLHNGASWTTILLIIASLIPAFYASLIDSILEIIPKLHQSIIPLQKNQVTVALGRLLLTGGMNLLSLPFTFLAIIAAGIPRIFGNLRLKKIAREFADTDQKPDPELRAKILSVVKRVLPGAIYFCLSGQVTIWLISVFGKTSDVAQLGGLGRINMLLTVISAIMVTLVIPRFARLQDTSRLKSYFWKIQLALWVLSATIVGFIWLFGDFVLMILGPKFTGLSYEITLSITGASIALMGGLSYALYSSRGWILNPIFFICVSFAALGLGIWIFDINSLVGVIKLDIFSSVIFYLIHSGYCAYNVYRQKPEDLNTDQPKAEPVIEPVQ